MNFKKLAVVGFISTSNLIDEIALKLGMRPRKRERNKETLFEYMIMVNEVYEKNLQIQIFHDDILEIIRQVEVLFLKNRGDLPLEYIKKILATYYDLRKIEVPNVYKGLSGEGYFDDTNLHLLSTGVKGRKDGSNKYTPILLQKIGEQERMLQQKLNTQLEQGTMEKVILLRKLRQGLNNKRGFVMGGMLKDNLNYHQNPNIIIKFIFIGIALLSLFLSIVVIAEIFLYPLTIPAVSNLLLNFLGVLAIIILLYKNIFRER